MLFSSIPFLFYFIPVFFILYAVAAPKLKNLVLLLATLVFYAWGEIRFIPVMIAISVIDYYCGKKIEQHAYGTNTRRAYMLVGVCANLFVLIFFKYFDFFMGSINSWTGLALPVLGIALPIGISFNTFQEISYVIDVYKGRTKHEKSYYNYLTFTTLFPQIIAGPIVRYVTINDDLDERTLTVDNFSAGMRRFLLGLGKKVLIANNVGALWNLVQTEQMLQSSVLIYWLGIIAFSFQIYFDFSGYSDMAIGIAQVLGFTFDENFHFPYIANSITDFWRRWHMTLGAWFRDYVYIPLGGNRAGPLVQVRNIIIVWALTGLWHGASWNFMFWGLYFAAILLLEKFFLLKYLNKAPVFVRIVYTMFLVLIGWVIFSLEDISSMGRYFSAMFGFSGIELVNSTALFYLKSYAAVFVVAAFFSAPWFNKFIHKAAESKKRLAQAGVTAFYLVIFLACVAYLVDSTYNPFLYLRF